MIVPLTKPYFTDEESVEVAKVLESGWVMQGEKVNLLEKEISSFVGTKFAVAVNSGTAALHLALLALGIGEGDEVIVPSFSFIASANSVLYTRATPIFADIDPKTYNIDLRDIERKITKKTKAIMAVHQVGLPADIEGVLNIAKKNNLLVIEDAACSLGATYKEKQTGSFGDIACFSLHPRKSITTGEGGIIVTNDRRTYQLLKSLRSHGVVKKGNKETYPNLGYNFRMTDIHAAIGIAQFKKLNYSLAKRKEIAEKYNHSFGNSKDIVIPFTPPDFIHTYQSYLVRIKKGKVKRDLLIKKLEEKGVSSRGSVMAIHREPLYTKLFGKILLPMTESANDEGLIIPLYIQMTEKEQEFVIKSLREAIL